MPDETPKPEDNIWPPGAPDENDYDRFTELVSGISEDPKTREKVEEAKREIEEAKKIAASREGLLNDMPESVLDGALGDLCYYAMLAGGRFPLAYAWPALLAVASAMAPRYNEKQRLNLFVALSGPVHSGKSQTIEAATSLLGIEEPYIMNMMAGSAEALVRKCKSANGEPRLFSPDELGHMLEKSHIENASFPYILNTAYYKSRFELHMGKKEVAEFNASLSILGGLVDSRFDDLFSSSSTGGLYDRFFFGACPGGFRFSYFPIEFTKKHFSLDTVGVHPEVWAEKEVWLLEDKELEPRVVEIAIRSAIICASFSGKNLLKVSDLGPARALANYETRIRRYLRPNEGENPEAKFAQKIIRYLKGLGGKYISKRSLFHNCGAERCGLTIANRALEALHANGDVIVTTKKNPPVLVRLNMDEERPEES